MEQYNVSVNHDGVRREELDGREHLVVPAKAVEEGVLDGGFLAANVINESEPGWNGVPVTAGHPTERGRFISANQPEVHQNLAFGKFFDADAEDGAMSGELWLDVEKADELAEDGFEKAQRAIEKLEDGEDISVSTSYIPTEREEAPGEYAGEPYQHEIEGIHPDHIAALPDGQGRDPTARTQVANALSSIENRVGEVLANVSGDADEDGDQPEVVGHIETLANSVEQVGDAVDDLNDRVAELESDSQSNQNDDGSDVSANEGDGDAGSAQTDFTGRLGGKDESDDEPDATFGSYTQRQHN